jgi:predicted DNA-binding protein with PD1-like motif
MKYTSGMPGRMFVLRFEDGDSIYKCIEDTAVKEQILSAVLWIIGGVKNGGVVVGPADSLIMPPAPVTRKFTEAHEIVGTGTIFLNEHDAPILHLHASMGHGAETITGCPREGLDCWLVSEVIIMEITGIDAKRLKDPHSNFHLLEIINGK